MKMSFDEVKKHLKQRYPFIMVDKVLDMELGAGIKAVKNITGNEICFLGHFPEYSILPGVLIIEALAQASAILLDCTIRDNSLKVLGVVNDMRILAPVYPGDCMAMDIKVIKMTEKAALVEAAASVDGNIVAKGKLSFGSLDIKKLENNERREG